MKEITVKVSELVKMYGEQRAVDQVSFELRKGEIIGFLGPNGAGKSTTMKMLTTYLSPTEGEIEILGNNAELHPEAIRMLIGYLPEQNPLYYDMYVHEYLNFIGKLHRIPARSLKPRVAEVVRICGLEREKRKRIGQLSKGYKQRVGLAQALVHDPPILILDEPTTGLDPNQILEIRQLIKDLSKEKTVLFSTHIMQEVQAICDRALIINKGKIVADKSTEELLKLNVDREIMLLTFAAPIDKSTIEGLLAHPGVEEIIGPDSGSSFEIILSGEMNPRSDILKLITQKDLPFEGLSQKQEDVSLEDVFRKLTK